MGHEKKIRRDEKKKPLKSAKEKRQIKKDKRDEKEKGPIPTD